MGCGGPPSKGVKPCNAGYAKAYIARICIGFNNVRLVTELILGRLADFTIAYPPRNTAGTCIISTNGGFQSRWISADRRGWRRAAGTLYGPRFADLRTRPAPGEIA